MASFLWQSVRGLACSSGPSPLHLAVPVGLDNELEKRAYCGKIDSVAGANGAGIASVKS